MINFIRKLCHRVSAVGRVLLFGEPRRPLVGLGVIVVKDGKILYGCRRGSHCDGQVCLPGGHLEYGESIEEGAFREVREETGLIVKVRRFDETHVEWCTVNNVLEGKHYVGLFVVADWVWGEPRVMEPGKSDFWKWAEFNETLISYSKPRDAWLPQELFVNHLGRILKVPPAA